MEDLAKKTRISSRRIDDISRMTKIFFGTMISITVVELAIIMLKIFA
jgi:cell division protein FtsL